MKLKQFVKVLSMFFMIATLSSVGIVFFVSKAEDKQNKTFKPAISVHEIEYWTDIKFDCVRCGHPNDRSVRLTLTDNGVDSTRSGQFEKKDSIN